MKILAGIQARMGSKRFHGKVLKKLGNKPILQHVYDRCKQFNVDDVLVLTTRDSLDIQDFCFSNKIKCNSNNYELECLYYYYNITDWCDYIVRVCGDSPFISIELANILIEKITDQDYLSYHIDGLPAILSQYGIFIEIIKSSMLKHVFEHVTPMFYHGFDCYYENYKPETYYKLSIDVPADLKRAEKIIKYNNGKIPEHDDLDKIFNDHENLQLNSVGVQRYDIHNS